ncbi:MAG: hypothetical protein IKV73_04820 [Clostridia bacterium]|nr:hypothetical protein [Clostridia bacterium]
MKTVTFCGHSRLPLREHEVIRERVCIETEKLIRQGATEFLLGGYGEFDNMCARVVKELKTKYPHIISVLVIPYIERDFDRELYDCSEYPPLEKVPRKFAIVKRNQYMVEKADVVVAYVKHTGGCAKTYTYAKRKKKHILLINDCF